MDPEKCDKRAGMLFYQSVVKFKDTFTESLPLHVRNKIHTITVKTAFDTLPASGGSDDVQGRLCLRAFELLNLQKQLLVKFAKMDATEKEEKTDGKAGAKKA